MAATSTEITLKPRELIDAIKLMAPTGLSFFVWGPPGVAKSSIVQQFAKESGRPMIDIRLSQIDAVDLRGMPYMPKGMDENSEDFGMKWSAPALLPKDPNSNAIIFLDEFPNATPSVHAAAYQLVLDRKLGDYEVPEGCLIIAAGNREGDRGNTFRLGAPIANRFVHFEIAPDFDSWREWAVIHGIDSSIVGFLSAFNDEAYKFEPGSATRGFPTYRTWEFVDRILNKGDFEAAPKQIQRAAISGAVGVGTMTKYLATRDSARNLPAVEEVLTGRVKTVDKLDTGLCYALTTSMCYALRKANDEAKDPVNKGNKQMQDDFTKKCDNFLRFLMTNFKPEIVVMGGRTALKTFRLDFDHKNMPAFQDFSKQFKSLLAA